MTLPVRRLVATALLAVTAGGCSTTARDPSPRQITVFAAASLTESFTTIAGRFEAAHPGVHVRLVFGASSELARQIVDGAAADVFAAASSTSVSTLTEAQLTSGKPAIFARNELELAIPADNRAGIHGLADLARGNVKFAVCAVEVPCGAAAKKLLAAAGLRARPATYERDVKAVLAKVRLGEVDAGLVYRTDIRAESRATSTQRVKGIEIPEANQASNDYPIVAIKRDRPATAASAFFDFVLSAKGRVVLADAGFDAP